MDKYLIQIDVRLRHFDGDALDDDYATFLHLDRLDWLAGRLMTAPELEQVVQDLLAKSLYHLSASIHACCSQLTLRQPELPF